jgi:hypothetical protein
MFQCPQHMIRSAIFCKCLKLGASNYTFTFSCKKNSPNKSDHRCIAAAVCSSMCISAHVTLSIPHCFTVRSLSAFGNKMLKINRVADSVYLLLRSVNCFSLLSGGGRTILNRHCS